MTPPPDVLSAPHHPQATRLACVRSHFHSSPVETSSRPDPAPCLEMSIFTNFNYTPFQRSSSLSKRIKFS